MKPHSHLSLKAAVLAALAAVLVGTQTPRATAQSSRPVTLTPGTVIPVKLNTALSSNESSQGDTFTAAVDDSKQAYSAILRGATVDGVVRRATPQAGDQPGLLDLAFTRLHLADGRSLALSGTPASLDTKALKTRADGVLVARNTNKDEHLTYAGIGAGAGALAGLLGGGKLKIEDILIGGGLGYAAGALLKGPTQVHDVELKSGTEMGVLLNNRVQYYHRAPKAKATHHARRKAIS